MRYTALATDGDGTLLEDGRISKHTTEALERARDHGILLLLVTGQTSKDLAEFPRLDLFHLVIAENGGVLFNPANGVEIVIGSPPPARLINALRDIGLKHLKIGRSMISADINDEIALRNEVNQLNLDWEVIRNRHDAMVLPPGVDKAS